MSRFFDLVQRLNEEPQNSSSASTGVSSQSTNVACELDRTLSILLPQDASYPAKTENGSASRQILSVLLPEGGGHPENPAKCSEFLNVPVEEAHIDAASRVVFHTDPGSPGADRFRFLRMRLRELWNTKKLRALLITSPLPEDGKSTIALNLATALAVHPRFMTKTL